MFWHFWEHDRHLGPGQVVASKPLSRTQQPKGTLNSKTIKVDGDTLQMPITVNLYQNIKEAKEHSAFDLGWFYNQVHSGGPWDYKKANPAYENFGNFHYGFVGTAQGIPRDVLLRAAGVGQYMDKHTHSGWGNPLYKSPYGDDPKDQYWIKKGILYYKRHFENP